MSDECDKQHKKEISKHNSAILTINFIKVILSKINEEKTLPAQKMKFSIKDFFSKCNQICSFLRIWSHLLKKCLMENFIFLCVTHEVGH